MASTLTTRKYTGISFDDIKSDLGTILKAKGGSLADFGESSYGRILVELFSGSADLMAFYAESAFNSSFLETAKSNDAIYAGARMLGYSVRRPIPPKAGIAVQLKKTGVYPTVKVRIPRGMAFTMGDITLTAVSDMTFSYTRSADTDLTGLMTLSSGMAVLAEGAFRTTTIISDGTKFQSFLIRDSGFSDWFGDSDPNYTDDSAFTQRKNRFTTVTSDATLAENFDPDDAIDDRIYWRIDRRGLEDPATINTTSDLESFVSGDDNRTNNYTVKMITANDGSVMLKFGDGLKSAIPYGELKVGYFATDGEDGNRLNVSGSLLSVSGASSMVITQADGTESDITVSDLNIGLTTDVRGGMNIESADSIRENAPRVFNSLDRLVNRISYKTFLRRYSDVRYANAFGEDILNARRADGTINVKYMNQVRFSALKDLYRLKDGKYYPTTSDEYYLDGFKVNGLMYLWQYDYKDIPDKSYTDEFALQIQNVYDSVTKAVAAGTETAFGSVSDVQTFFKTYVYPNVILDKAKDDPTVFAARLTPYDFVEAGSEIDSLMKAMDRRSMLTLGGGYTMYSYPAVHDFEMHISLTLFRGQTFTDIKEKIQNSVYRYLRTYTEFATPIYRSKIAAIVHEFPEVAGVDVTFAPKSNGYETLDLTSLTWLGDATAEFISTSLDVNGFSFSLKYNYCPGTEDSSVLYSDTFAIGSMTEMQSRIASSYGSIVNGTAPITETVIENFCAYIWESMMQMVYTSVYTYYTTARSLGQMSDAQRYIDVIRAIKGWSTDGTSLSFADTDTVLSMGEVNGNGLFEIIRYGLEYVKLVRNILSYRISEHMIDPDTGNIDRYTGENEIVQFTVSPENMTITTTPESTVLETGSK